MSGLIQCGFNFSKIDSNDWENSRYIKLYDPLRLYSIPPFMSPNPTEAQTILLIKWLPWTDDAFVTLSIDRISVVTNVTKAMNTFYDDSKRVDCKKDRNITGIFFVRLEGECQWKKTNPN